MSGGKAPSFDLIVVVDFSAAASPGPAKPASDRCWTAIERDGVAQEPQYFRTRGALSSALLDLLQDSEGNALIAWDFPFGYPIGSGLGGGRAVAGLMHGLVEDGPTDQNNRFRVADELNRRINSMPGPFWGRPRTQPHETITEKKPPRTHHAFSEWRLVELAARAAGFPSIQSVWKLYTTGSVGGQAIMGLALIERLNHALGGRQTRYWPFETGWDQNLDGVVHVECWPSLFAFDHIDHPIRDARQVAATRDVIAEANRAGRMADFLGQPSGLSVEELTAVATEEGWIMGLRTGPQSP